MRGALLAVPVVVVVAALGLAACTSGGSTPSASPTASTVSTATPSATPTLSPAVQTALSTFDGTNRKTAAANADADDRAIVDALVGAGLDKSAMQITPDTTTIGRRVDSIEVSLLVDKTCLVGQFRGSAYVSTNSPVLSTGRCLLGTTRAIDW
jgi:hypothetical protein